VSVPFGTRNLFIGCSDDKQFGGILKLLQELNRRPGSHLLERRGTQLNPEQLNPEQLNLEQRRVLQRVLISGHGHPNQAGFELDSPQALRPPDLRLPGSTGLYLMGCYQGSERQRFAWAAGTGVDAKRVWGCAGETESALSTCLLLHLLEGGAESIDRWFPVWIRCNDAFRPDFPMIREVYARVGADPVAALAILKAAGNLKELFREFDEFLVVISRRPDYLTDLM
jgi:hypothetical protein